MTWKRWGVVAGCLCGLAVAPGMAQAPSAPPYIVLPLVPSGAPPPPPLPPAPPAPAVLPPAGAPQGAGSSDPGFDDMNVVPSTPAAFTNGSSTTPGASGATDELTVLEGMINRLLELQRQATIEIDSVSVGARTREAVVREVTQLSGTIEGMFASSSWTEAVAHQRATEDPLTTRNYRYLKIYGQDGHLQILSRQQDRIRAFLKAAAGPGLPPDAAKGGLPGDMPPLPVGSAPPATGTDPGVVVDNSIAGQINAVQKRIDEVSLKLAESGLTPQRKQELEMERNALVQRMAELVRKAPGSTDPSTRPDGHQPAPAAAPGSTAGAPGATGTTAGAPGATGSTAATGAGNPLTTAAPAAPGATPGVQVPLVGNSYGINPPVVSDAQIRAIMDPLIAKELPVENAKLSQKGLSINVYRQLTGTSGKTRLISVGKPDYDHYREWIKSSPAIKTAVDARAAAIYEEKARALAAAAPPPPPPATPAPAQNPQAQTGGATAPESSGLPPGTTLPNGKLDLPSSSAR